MLGNKLKQSRSLNIRKISISTLVSNFPQLKLLYIIDNKQIRKTLKMKMLELGGQSLIFHTKHIFRIDSRYVTFVYTHHMQVPNYQ